MTRKTGKNKGNNTQITMWVVVAAVMIAVIAIVISSTGSRANNIHIDYSKIPQARTDDGGFILGDSNANVTLIAFEDFLCPHCQEYEPTIARFIQDYVATGQARFEYRFMPVISPTLSYQAARIVECSEILKPGSFWDAYDVMFELASAERYNNNTPRQLAERIGLDYAQLLDCVPTATQVETDINLGDRMGVTGTPTLFIQYGSSTPQRTPPRPTLDMLGALVVAVPQ